MKAIILAAGLGTRLKKITQDMPKALVEVNGKTMLEIAILNLKNQGFNHFLINIHHEGKSIIDFLASKNNFGVNIIISDEREQLLDTGGAILKAKEFIAGNEPVLVHNVDVISDVNISKLFNYHKNNNAVATLCVRKRETQRFLLFNNSNNLIGWTNLRNKEFKWVNKSYSEYYSYAFSGIYVISPKFVDLIKQTGKFSIIDSWLEIANTNIINAYVDTANQWHDLGTIEKIIIAEKSGFCSTWLNGK
jgi:N-acetyl-alpha-D-muramate 1-phosphate uridylyltransferase